MRNPNIQTKTLFYMKITTKFIYHKFIIMSIKVIKEVSSEKQTRSSAMSQLSKLWTLS